MHVYVPVTKYMYFPQNVSTYMYMDMYIVHVVTRDPEKWNSLNTLCKMYFGSRHYIHM